MRFWPTLFTMVMLICLCLLGNWQVERLDWKLDLITKLESRLGLEPVALPATVTDMNEWEYRPVQVRGSYLHMREMPMYRVGPNGRPGYDLFTPLLMKDGRTVIVDRGWVPENLKGKATRPETVLGGAVVVTGLLRKPWKKLWYGPDNAPRDNDWFFGDIEGMKSAQQLENTFPMYLYANKGPSSAYPIGGRSRLKLINNHLDYALTWYGLAVTLLIIYIIYSYKNRWRNPEH